MDDGSQQPQSGYQARQYQALADVAEAVAANRDLASLLQDLKGRLKLVVRFNAVQIVLHDPERDVMRRYFLEPSAPGEQVVTELGMDEAPGGLVWRTQEPLLITDPAVYQSRYPWVVAEMIKYRIKTVYILPLTALGRRLGAIVFTSRMENAWSEDDRELLEQVAKMVAITVDNVINFESARAAEEAAKRQSERLQLLLEINNAVSSHLELRTLMQTIFECLRKVLPYDVVGLSLYDPETDQLRSYANVLPDHQPFIEEGEAIPLEGSVPGLVFRSGKPVLMDRLEDERFQSDWSKRFRAAGFKSGGSVPLTAHGRKLGTLGVACRRETQISQDDVDLLCQVAGQVAIAVENALAFREIESLKNKLTSEKLYLEAEIRTEHNFEELVGSSPSFKRILKQVETVAPTDSAVLIRGETGTGKELLARAIHNLSERRDRTLVKINCAAIPTGLLESELFGHEKGAFTGAISQRIGRFELAHRGTLFLDEVGDIPLELQPKLLRVLQEQEFERLGSTRTQKVDVRLIAATNSDLEQMVGDKRYRGDLYYRLNVFPITIPPLRERAEDIPALARFFTQKCARRMKKHIDAIPTEAMAALCAYHWPGNVRELEHLIERAVILTQGHQLEVSLSDLKPQSVPAAPAGVTTLETAEREHILRALEEAHWVIGGPNGAAARLGMKRTTLQSRMQKLGLARTGS